MNTLRMRVVDAGVEVETVREVLVDVLEGEEVEIERESAGSGVE